MGNEITKQDIQALIRTQVMDEIIEGAVKESAVLRYFRRLPDMTSNQTKMTVLDNLPIAYWQTSDTAFKRVTSMAWRNKYIIPEELAVIVPIAENYLADSGRDLWAEIKPRIIEAFGKKIDQAIIMGIDKPQHFRMSLIDSAINAGATVTETTNLYKDINDAMAYVEESDFNPSAIMGSVALKSAFRMLVDSTGQPIKGTEIDSIPKLFMDNGAWDKTRAKFMVGDFSQAVYAIRQDVTFKIIDQGCINDPVTKELLYNLPQQDMIAIRAVMRLGWEVPNPITAENPDNSTRFPFSVVVPSSGAMTTYTAKFTVKDDTASSPVAIENATVIFAGQEKTTNSSGEASFTVPANTTATYAVTAPGKQANMGKVTVETSNKDIAITLLGE